MDHDDLAHWSKRAADWARDYHAVLRDRPVRPDIAPGDFRKRIEAPVPEAPTPIETVFDDFARLVPAAMTHWQHPRFFAYFPANAAPASMLAEQLANAMASQALSLIPTFILIGYLAYYAGLTKALFTAAKRWIAWVPGGMAVATVFALRLPSTVVRTYQRPLPALSQ